MKAEYWLLLLMIVEMILFGNSLKCWKCIAHDCENSPEKNYKASKVDCESGQHCMKVRYRMYDNVTYYDSVIRTCTAGPCHMNTVDEFQTCLSTPKHYMISGCSLRTCCSDRDLCNSVSIRTSSSALTFLFVTLGMAINCLTL